MLRRDATIVQEDAKIVQTSLKRACLDDFPVSLDDIVILFAGMLLSLHQK